VGCIAQLTRHTDPKVRAATRILISARLLCQACSSWRVACGSGAVPHVMGRTLLVSTACHAGQPAEAHRLAHVSDRVVSILVMNRLVCSMVLCVGCIFCIGCRGCMVLLYALPSTLQQPCMTISSACA